MAASLAVRCSRCDNESTHMSHVVDSLDAAREAAARHHWREAHEAYATAPEDALTPEDLERYAEATWWMGRRDDAVGLRQRAYAAYTAAGDKLPAARIAVSLFWDHMSNGAFAVARGWLAKAERILEALPESPVHGYFIVSRAFGMLFGEGALGPAGEAFDEAYELSQRFGEPELEAMALVGKGKILVASGQVEEGLVLLDEATAAATGGGLRPFAVGFIYCCTIDVCQSVGDYRRAQEWTDAANRWCDTLDVSGMPGACRVHRASLMRLKGDWPQAEKQALSACEELSEFNRFVTGFGHYEIGEIRRRRGDFATAHESYANASEWGHEPQPGLALLELAEGKVESAEAGISRALEHAESPLHRVQMLPAQIEIALAANEVPTARAAAEELERLVEEFKIGRTRAPAFDAGVQVARGQIALAEGDSDVAAHSLRQARDLWQGVGAPYEIAQTRMLLGLAFRRQGDEHAATAELEAAKKTFTNLGAKLDEARADELLGRVETSRTFLFTDIVDSTAFLSREGPEKWRKLLARHDELVRDGIRANGGEVIKHTGDGFFAAFDSPKAAVEAAIAIQRALAAEVFAADVRIGAHAGGAFRTRPGDYGGEGVHVAARIGAAAGAGEILVSRETLDGYSTAFRTSIPREQVLKGFEEPVEVVSIEWR
jgi:class 3 adenylate cyclase